MPKSAVADYVFHFDAPLEGISFNKQTRITGWLLHRQCLPTYGIRGVVRGTLRRRSIFKAHRKRSTPLVAVAYPDLPEAGESGFLLELELPPGRSDITIQVHDHEKTWRTILATQIWAFPLTFLGRIGLPRVEHVLVTSLTRLFLGEAKTITACLRSANFRELFPVVLRELAVMREKIDTMELSQFIATVMPRCLHSGKFQDIFLLWERHGFHVTPVHFYQPIPDTQSLPETLWTRPSELVGSNMNDSGQLDLLRKHFPKFRDEYEQFPTTPAEEPGHFYLNNHIFGAADALVAYCMVRHFQPQLIIEVGSGFSSLLLGQAVTKNNSGEVICIEPFPQEFLKRGFPGLHSLIEKKIQDVDLDFFSQLGSGDILFIDSSHTLKIGGDVNYLFLEVLPRLKPGVIVHVHDIFFPFDYRRDWVKEEFRFWTEQYLLQAFLAFNSEFEVLIANSYLSYCYRNDLKATFPSLPALSGCSFWMRRKQFGSDSE